jgi:xanthine dehydrogenase accessory factor
MKEIKDIIRAYDKATAKGMRTALATVVSVEGSSYRRPGARMLITEEGQLTGAISGGCLEGDALRKALYVMSAQKPMVVTYDTTDEDDARVGVGLGCNGIIRILIEPIQTALTDNPVALLKTVVAKRTTAVMVSIFSFDKSTDKQPGTCLLYYPDEQFIAAGFSSERSFSKEVSQAFSTEESFSISYNEGEHLFTSLVEVIKPSPSLVIFGAGNDAFPIVEIAGVLAWDVTVIDGRRNYATSQRFPTVQQLKVAKPEEALPGVRFDRQTVCVLMTHNYNYDLAIFRQLLNKEIRYVGVLGPKKRLFRMLDDLKGEGMQVNEDDLSKIYGPVGLDIGAETAEEIAISIIAEIKAVLNNKTGSSLRGKQGSIHLPFHSEERRTV